MQYRVKYNYYPFGMVTPGRSYSAGSGYRFGFNRYENDDEIRGDNNALNFGGRSIYDPRIGKFISTDPRWRNFPNLSPYSFAANNPTYNIDGEGKAPIPGLKEWGVKNGYTTALIAGILDGFAGDIEFASEAAKTGFIYYQVYFLTGPIGTLGYYVLSGDANDTYDAVENFTQIITDVELRNNAIAAIEGAFGDYIDNFIGENGNGEMGYSHGEAIYTALSTVLGGEAFFKFLKEGRFAASEINAMRKSLIESGQISKISKINKTVNGITAKRVRNGWAKGKVAVIGEGMENNVKPFANGLNATTFKPSQIAQQEFDNLKKLYNNGVIPDDQVIKTLLYKENVEWINRMVDEGYTIYDVGGKGTSKFYNMEVSTAFE